MFDDSPFTARLGTNYVPSEEEIKDLRGLLVDPLEQLAKIQAQIDEMDLLLDQLKARRDSFQTAIDAHRALISPMRRIPDDVLGEIFAACLPTEHNALIDLAEAPLLLGRICRRWRAVSYSTPMLWSSIHIAPLRSPWANERSVDFFPQLKPVIQQWFERTVTCPLTVSLVEASSYASDPDTHPISILRNFSHQFRHLSLAGDPRLLLPPLRLGPESLPVLKSIAIYNDTNRRYPFGIEHPEALNLLQIPTLTDISLRVMVDPLSLPLNWSQLTHLDIRCFPPTRDSGLDGVGALELLQRCPNLMRCRLGLYKGLHDSSLASNTSLITLPHLHTLILVGTFQLPNWISHFDVPQLRRLQIGNDGWLLGVPNSPHSMIVAVDTTPFTESSLLELLQAFPLISHLQLLPHRLLPASLPNDALLLHLSSTHNLCPNLTHLRIKTDCTSLSDATALAFIQARMASPDAAPTIRG
ncbi:hypothetical protein MSAN_00837100 [Mycena sanguinolenta]|uniref:F-box domain-containing protein n=1 Tax=Mycena sanguinolenta TaxID=230812 RepID=A0A8H6YZA8_9AGAR|nr:hypothetical protein MSAN_00837100 [Mycena sanguinolenta]